MKYVIAKIIKPSSTNLYILCTSHIFIYFYILLVAFITQNYNFNVRHTPHTQEYCRFRALWYKNIPNYPFKIVLVNSPLLSTSRVRWWTILKPLKPYLDVIYWLITTKNIFSPTFLAFSWIDLRHLKIWPNVLRMVSSWSPCHYAHFHVLVKSQT